MTQNALLALALVLGSTLIATPTAFACGGYSFPSETARAAQLERARNVEEVQAAVAAFAARYLPAERISRIDVTHLEDRSAVVYIHFVSRRGQPMERVVDVHQRRGRWLVGANHGPSSRTAALTTPWSAASARR